MHPTALFLQFMEDSIIRTLTLSVGYLISSGVKGDLAEFGTMTGSTASVLARALEEVRRVWGSQDEKLQIPTRKLHLFDSFEGLPQSENPTDQQSPFVQANIWASGVCKGLNETELRQAVSQFLPSELIITYPGWFQETLPLIPKDSRFALVHLDCDLYSSSFEVLDHLIKHELLSEGAMLLFDDWNAQHASPDFGQRKAWSDILERYPGIRISEMGGYGLTGFRMIYHGRTR